MNPEPPTAEVEWHVHDAVATVTFGDPARKNVLTPTLLDAIPQALDAAVRQKARVIVLRGRGTLWSAGYDIATIPAAIFSADPQVVASHPFEKCMRALEQCPVVTLAALRGAAFGGALELALSCDLRLAEAGCQLGLPPARLGIIYSHTGIQKLVRLVGAAQARWLLFTAETIDASEAARIGLVNRCTTPAEFEDKVARIARQVARGAPLAIQGMKRILQMLETGDGIDASQRQEILQLRQQAFESRDFAEGRRAFAEKRAPGFEGQ
jgi:enoyl-CoA hydratase/carnithine racemase